MRLLLCALLISSVRVQVSLLVDNTTSGIPIESSGDGFNENEEYISVESLDGYSDLPVEFYSIEDDNIEVEVGMEPVMEMNYEVTVELEDAISEDCSGCTLDLFTKQAGNDTNYKDTIAIAEFLLQSQEIIQLNITLENKDLQISNLKLIAGELENHLEEVKQETNDSLNARNKAILEISEEEIRQEVIIDQLQSQDDLINCEEKTIALEEMLSKEHRLKKSYQQELEVDKEHNRETKSILDENIVITNFNKILLQLQQKENEICKLIQSKQLEEMKTLGEMNPQKQRIVDETTLLQNEVDAQRAILEMQEQAIQRLENVKMSQDRIMAAYSRKNSKLSATVRDLFQYDEYHDDEYYDEYDDNIIKSYNEIVENVRLYKVKSEQYNAAVELKTSQLQNHLNSLNESLIPCALENSYEEIRNVSSLQTNNINLLTEQLNQLLPEDRQLHLPENTLTYGLPQPPKDSLLTMTSVSMSCPPKTKLSTSGKTLDIFCPMGVCSDIEDWPECVKDECIGSYIYGVEYNGNDIGFCHTNKKATPQECQEFCKSIPGCVGWEWGYSGDNCCAKSKMGNRRTLRSGSSYSGRVAGLRNSCPPGTAGCSCSDFVNRNGYGKCKKGESNIFEGSVMCYVNLPSNCPDLLESGTNPGKWRSAEACRSNSDTCMTTASMLDLNRDPSKGEVKCVFPFYFNGKLYNKCATGSAGNLRDDALWCSTKVDKYGTHVSGQGEWGYCSSGCPS